MIRSYNEKDVKQIEKLGLLLHDNYKFNLDLYSKCLVLLQNDKLIGFITYAIIYDRAEIIDIIVDGNHRNNGNATKLLDAVINDCYKNNCNNITLEVSSKNTTAISFYQKNGFSIAAIRKKYYNVIDGYLMKKEVR